MQTVFDADLHLDRGVQLGVRAQRVYHDVHLLDDIVQTAADGGPEEVPVGGGQAAKGPGFTHPPLSQEPLAKLASAALSPLTSRLWAPPPGREAPGHDPAIITAGSSEALPQSLPSLAREPGGLYPSSSLTTTCQALCAAFISAAPPGSSGGIMYS